MGWITRFLPGLSPAFGALLNPWVLLGLLAALVGAYLAGLREGHQQLEQYQAAVQAVGKAAEARRALQIREQNRITKEADDGWKRRQAEDQKRHTDSLARMRRDLERLRTDPSRRPADPVPKAPEGGRAGEICFQRDTLNRGVVGALANLHERRGANLARLLEGTAGVLQRGDAKATDFLACATWVLEQKAAADALAGATAKPDTE